MLHHHHHHHHQQQQQQQQQQITKSSHSINAIGPAPPWGLMLHLSFYQSKQKNSVRYAQLCA
jgi:hypothetical protein